MAIKDKTTNEHIEKIIGKSKYKINEVSYRLADEDFSADDIISPDVFDDPKAVQPASMGQSNIFSEDEEDLPEIGPPEEEMADDSLPPVDGDMPAEEPVDGLEGQPEEAPIEAPAVAPEPEEPSVDDLQNDLIKLNISTMQQMNSKVAELEKTLSVMDSKFMELDKDVEEVREPTNVEKLTSRKVDSHPFYYGLNDMWDGNTFQARRDEAGERGMKQMEDGSFIADFDQMNKFTDYEVKDSFDI
jgi:hypothetical protein